VKTNFVKANRRISKKRALVELVHLQKELQRREKLFMTMKTLYSSIFTQANYVIFARNLEGTILAVNQPAVELFGYNTAEEMTGLHVSQLLSPKSFKSLMKEQQKWLRDRCIKQQYYEHELSRKNGEKLICEAAPSLIKKNGQIVGIMATARDISEQRQRQENMQLYFAEITRAQEEERKYIARELHDTFIQELATISLKIDMLLRSRESAPKESFSQLKQLQSSINDTARKARFFAQELRPGDLDQLGLIPVLTSLTNKLHNEEKEINTHFETSGSRRRLPPETELALFRITQEALRNVKKHARATEVLVKVEFDPAKVRLRIHDNGRGFKVPKAAGDFTGKGKLGLIGMQERVRLLGGTFSIKSQMGKGTEITVEVKA
jgi:two-component system sensor histidine kinase DegS